MKLTVGMATYNDFDGAYFTIQSLRMHHPEVDEIVVVDNYGSDRLKDWIQYWCKDNTVYDRYTDIVGTTMPRQRVFEIATGDIVIVIDSHVLLMPDALNAAFPDNGDLFHGPMCYDDFSYVTHMEDRWQEFMWGVWAEATKELPNEPFEIPMHGLGLFGCRRDEWLGFNKDFRGFGGEEGYIHTKFRKAGRKTVCLPKLRWIHRFGKSSNFPLRLEDRIRNYVIGFTELDMDLKPIYEHFGTRMVEHAVNGGTIG